MRDAEGDGDRAFAVGVVVAANAAVVAGLWLRHGGAGNLGGAGGPATAAGQLTALLGTYAVLIVLLLMSRIAWLERAIGFDRLAVWHRWGGFSAVTLLGAHSVLTIVGYAQGDHRSVAGQVRDFVSHYPDVLMAFVAMGLLVAIAVASMRWSRARLRRETWYALHLYAYLAVALAFAHQLAVGTDFSADRLARVWWALLYVAVGSAILWWRFLQPVVFNLRHRLRVEAVHPEADGVVSIYLGGEGLDRIGARAGQFFLWRFFTRSGWAKAHPFSLSASPRRDLLRITVKGLGDDTRRLSGIPVGTRVFAEGPYGTFTADRRRGRFVALIAGGIGITPIRALLEDLSRQGADVTVVYRAANEGDVAFREELDSFATRDHVSVSYVVDPRIGDDDTDALGVRALQRLVPDIRNRDVYVCGPPAMVDAVCRRLRRLHVRRDQIHFERFAY